MWNLKLTKDSDKIDMEDTRLYLEGRSFQKLVLSHEIVWNSSVVAEIKRLVFEGCSRQDLVLF